MNHPKITELSKAFKSVFTSCYFEYAKEGSLEKGKKLTGNKVNPLILSDNEDYSDIKKIER